MKQEERKKETGPAAETEAVETEAAETETAETGPAEAEPTSEAEATDEATAAEAAEAVEATEETSEEAEAATGLLSPPATAALRQFAAALTESDRQALAAALGRLSGLLEAGREATRQAEEEACLRALEGEAAFADIRTRLPGMQELIKALPWLRALPLRDRLAAACCLDRGRKRQPPTEEERLTAVLSDPALLRALAERQASLRRAGGQGVPPAPGLGRAPAFLKAPPASLSEAKAEAKRALRVR